MKRTMIILLIVAIPLFIWFYMRSKAVKVIESPSEAPEPLKPNSTDYESDESDEIGTSTDKRKVLKTAKPDSISKIKKIAATRDSTKMYAGKKI